MPDDIRQRLEDAGRRPVPDPRPGFEDALEARLMAMDVTPAPVRPTRSAWRRPAFRLAAGFASLALVLGIVAFGGMDDRSALAYELTGSVNVEVALTDGTTLTDPDGLLLPDGAVVRVGADGFARVGDVELREGDVARLIDGRLRIDRQPTGAVQTDATPTGTASTARPPTLPPSPGPTPSSSVPATPSTTSRPSDAPPTVRPTPTGTTAPSPAPTKDPPKTATPDAGAPTKSPTDPRRIRLEARVVGESGIRATWTAVPDARRYVLLGTRSKDGPARDPSYPAGAVVGVFTHPPDKPLVFRVGADVVEVRLVVVALDRDGNVVGRSRIVTLSMAE